MKLIFWADLNGIGFKFVATMKLANAFNVQSFEWSIVWTPSEIYWKFLPWMPKPHGNTYDRWCKLHSNDRKFLDILDIWSEPSCQIHTLYVSNFGQTVGFCCFPVFQTVRCKIKREEKRKKLKNKVETHTRKQDITQQPRDDWDVRSTISIVVPIIAHAALLYRIQQNVCNTLEHFICVRPHTSRISSSWNQKSQPETSFWFEFEWRARDVERERNGMEWKKNEL